MKRVIAAAVVLIMVLGTAFAGCDRDQTKDEEIVSLTWPMEIVTETPEDFNEDLFLSENEGFTKASPNEDGTVDVSMTKSTYDYIKDQFNQQFSLFFEELVSSDQTSYIEDIDYEPDFRNIEIKVEKSGYESDEEIGSELLPTVAMNIAQYHQITGLDEQNTLTLVDNETSEVIQTFNYPEDIEQ
ncbi:MAG: hypothetical protein ACLFPS_06420 [Clostridia bacterium]